MIKILDKRNHSFVRVNEDEALAIVKQYLEQGGKGIVLTKEHMDLVHNRQKNLHLRKTYH